MDPNTSPNETIKTKSFLEPNKIFDQIPIRLGMHVADFGTGAGHFTIEAARRVAPSGKVYALDILTQALESVESRAMMESLNSIETRRVNLEKLGGSTLDDASIDLVIAKDILFMNQDKKVILEEIVRVLALGGMVFLAEWDSDPSNVLGPPLEKRLRKEDLLKLAYEVGLGDERVVSVGDYHYGFLFIKKEKAI
ncbi:MAG: methyltransferase domain-containing protein [Candidatus Moraniibacteriota bacterium]|nr:MAG: methyltransferase domain-containing protein [Candidatus Moranbacteria bacterium]